jgi:hypothetical protein
VRPDRAEALAWEDRWSLPVGLTTLAAVALVVVSAAVVSSIGGSGEAELLRSAHEHASDLTLSSILQAVGFGLLAAPLCFLFRATRARSDRIRRQFVGVVVAAPLFLCVAALLNGAATREAADEFVAGKATTGLTIAKASANCREERQEDASKFGEEFGKGAGAVRHCAGEEVADEEATEAVSGASLRGPATGFGLGGRLGLAFALVYTCLYAMRAGLLTRFWGALGIAVGAAALLLLIQFTLIWFIYFGLLAAGWLPRGRPPAWAAGEAIPWPTPGEKAATELSSQAEDPEGAGSPPAGGAERSPPPEDPEAETPAEEEPSQ